MQAIAFIIWQNTGNIFVQKVSSSVIYDGTLSSVLTLENFKHIKRAIIGQYTSKISQKSALQSFNIVH